jgi:hypothetical protein
MAGTILLAARQEISFPPCSPSWFWLSSSKPRLLPVCLRVYLPVYLREYLRE